MWRVHKPGEPPNIDSFVWGYIHLVTELRVKIVLMDSPTDHIILTEQNDPEPARGLLVRVIPLLGCKERIRCQLVGQIHFLDVRLVKYQKFMFVFKLSASRTL